MTSTLLAAAAERVVAQAELRVMRQTLDIDIQIQLDSQFGISDLGFKLLSHVAGSRSLSKSFKKNVIRLIAMIEQFAQGGLHDKLLHDLAAIVGFEESVSKNQKADNQISIKDALAEYNRVRKLLNGQENTTINLRVHIEQFSLEFTGKISADAIAAGRPFVADILGNNLCDVVDGAGCADTRQVDVKA